MADDPFTLPSLDGPPPGAEHGQGEHGVPNEHDRQKHKKKVRSAWISFIGRIIAQIAGAAATIVIGLAVLSQYPRDRQKAADAVPSSGAAAAAVLPLRTDPSPDDIDVAVLPFEHLSPDASQAYVAEALTEATIAAIACIEALHVVSRTSSMQYRAPHKPLGVIATELAVDFVVEGAVTVYDGRVRVTAQLVDAVSDHEVWARTYDRKSGDVLALQTDVSSAIARDLTAAILSRRAIRWSPEALAPCEAPAVTPSTPLTGGRGGG